MLRWLKVSDAAVTLSSADDDHPLAGALFAIPGVTSVFAVNDFVTVTKSDNSSWGSLTKPVIQALQGVLGE